MGRLSIVAEVRVLEEVKVLEKYPRKGRTPRRWDQDIEEFLQFQPIKKQN
jgi:hypothetical protein